MRTTSILLLLAIATAAVNGRLIEDISGPAAGRSLLQTGFAVCPANCDECTRAGTGAPLVCNKCKATFVPIKGQCGCAAGKYFPTADRPLVGTGTAGQCNDCPIGYYCPGGVEDANNLDIGDTPISRADLKRCGDADGTGMTTRTKRSRSANQCVNQPGYYYQGADKAAIQCEPNTFTAGLLKQKACTPCPTGTAFSDTTKKGSTSVADCKVPPGYYLKTPSQVAPCPKGEYKEGYTAATTIASKCTPCPNGVTTTGSGSTQETDCNNLLPGFAAKTVGDDGKISEAEVCPQKFYCPGGKPSGQNFVEQFDSATVPAAEHIDSDSWPKSDKMRVYKCSLSDATGLFTKSTGATSKNECMLPPGHEVRSNAVAKCENGFRSGWVPYTRATATTSRCTPCGRDVSFKEDGTITVAGSDIDVAETAGSCYIEKGWGMYYTSGGTYYAKGCTGNFYGVAGKTYGQAANPCRPCAQGLVTGTLYKEGNFYFDVRACQTQDGWGWDGRVATQCAKGTYNAAGNLDKCKPCGFGLTTSDAGAASSAACGLAQGYGKVDSVIQLCPLGFYNSDDWKGTGTAGDQNAACATCPGNTYTLDVGSDASADCNVCKPGYGKSSDGNTCVECASGYYGPPATQTSANGLPECVACEASGTGFTFFYNSQNDPYIPDPVSNQGSTSPSGCVAKYAQIVDGLFYLSGGDLTSTASRKGDFHECLAACDTVSCHFATFDYKTTGDNCLTYTAGDGTAAATIAYKAVPSGDILSAQANDKLKAKSATASGLYTQYKIGALTRIPGETVTSTNMKLAVCMSDCDAAADCAGIYWASISAVADDTAACTLLTGVSNPGNEHSAKRTLIRADPTKMGL